MYRNIIALLCLVPMLAHASVSVTVNGTSHTIPQTNERGWGSSVTAWIQAISQYTLQPTGGTFTLTAETDFGATYGLKVPYIKTQTATPATAGVVRLAKTDVIDWRNTANGANLPLGIDTSDNLTFNSVIVPTATSASVQDSTFTIYDNVDSTKKIAFQASGITTATTRTITMPDSNVDLGSLVNANISSSAAIAYSKLSLGTSILNADVNGSAAIALTKLAATTASRALVSDGSGFVTPSTTTATEIGYVNGATSSLQNQITAITSAASEPNEIHNCSIAASVAASALTVALKDGAGSDPAGGSACKISFRNATAATGSYTEVSTTAAVSVVLSNGSAAGCTASAACVLYVYGVYTGSAVVLGIIEGANIDEGSVYTSTILAGSGNDDAAFTLYTTATQTSKPVRLLGRIVITPAAAFAWTNSPTEISNVPISGGAMTRTAFTPTGTFASGGNTTYTGVYWRIQDRMHIQYKLAFAGAPTSTTLLLNMPSGFTIDTSKLIDTSVSNMVGSGSLWDNGVLIYDVMVGYATSTTLEPFAKTTSSSFATAATITQASPFAIGISDQMVVDVEVPIVGW